MEALIPFSKILSFIGIITEPRKKNLTPTQMELRQQHSNHIEYNGRKIFLNPRDPNEPLPPGYEDWRITMMNERGCYVSRFPETN